MKFEFLQNAILVRNHFSKDELDAFIDNQKTKQLYKSGVTGGGRGGVNENVRLSMQVTVHKENPNVVKLRDCVTQMNEKYLKVNLSEVCRENHFVEYWETGKFEAHTDIIWPKTIMNHDENSIRKLTTIVLLNEDFTGGKLALWFAGDRYSFSFSPGDVITFPSYIQHKVDPVESGIRYSLVSWSYGEF